MYHIAILPGDGIGTEIVPEAVKVLQVAGAKYNIEFKFTEALIGGAAYDQTGLPLPAETLKLCQQSDAILLGAIGGEKWDKLLVELRPEIGGILALRKQLQLFANLRPCRLYPGIIPTSPLKADIIDGADLLVVRELTGGLYFGEKQHGTNEQGIEFASDNLIYTVPEIERIVRLAFKIAQTRRKKLCSVDKANVLASSRLWRSTVERLAADYPEVETTHMYVDNCAMQLISNPRQFDVIVTENMFGDILTDEASVIAGSIGMLPSASLGGQVGLYEPSHGSAPDIAGQQKANPLATILSAAMLLKYSLQQPIAAQAIENSVAAVLAAGYRTADLKEAGASIVSTSEMGDLVVEYM